MLMDGMILVALILLLMLLDWDDPWAGPSSRT